MKPAYQRVPDELGFLVGVEQLSVAQARSAVVMSELLDRFARRACAFAGHKWEDDSYGGPEGGCVAVTCARCGYHIHQTLY